MGGTLGPSLVGLCTKSAENDIQSGILSASIFPIMLIVCFLFIRREQRMRKREGN